VHSKSEAAKVLQEEFAHGFCADRKFRRTGFIPKVEISDEGALAKSLSVVRGNPLYLYWKNAKIVEKEHPRNWVQILAWAP
jgi:hypothetical protein